MMRAFTPVFWMIVAATWIAMWFVFGPSAISFVVEPIVQKERGDQ